MSRRTQGVTVFKVAPDETVVSVTKLSEAGADDGDGSGDGAAADTKLSEAGANDGDGSGGGAAADAGGKSSAGGQRRRAR
jgi:hypothetical protein